MAIVILNPYAGRWKGRESKEDLVKALNAAGVPYEMIETNYPGHGIELARLAVNNGDSPIIAAGGDGSINEVVNGMLQSADGEFDHLPPLGVIPLGSANDFTDNLGIPRDILTAAKVIAGGNQRRIDICQVNDRYFDNNSAIGLEPFVTLIQEKIKRLRGTTRYLLATLKGIYRNPQWTMHLEWDNGSYEGPVTLVTVGNCPRTGGLFFMTPHADPFDGKLTFVYGYLPTRLQILRTLPRTMRPGKGSYVEQPAMHEIHAEWLKIKSDQPTPAHADGVIISREIQELEYRILPSVLPVLLPLNERAQTEKTN